MPVKKVSTVVATSSGAAAIGVARPRKRTSLNSGGPTNRSEVILPSTAAINVAAASAKKAGAKTRISVTSTPITAQQAALAAAQSVPTPPPPTSNVAAPAFSSVNTTPSAPRTCATAVGGHPDLHAPAAVAAAAATSSSGAHASGSDIASTPSHKTTAVKAAFPSATKVRLPAASSQTTTAPAASSDPPAVAAPSPNQRGGPHHADSNNVSVSTSASIAATAPVLRRQRGSTGGGGANPTGPVSSGSAAPSTNSSPVPVLRATRTAISAASTPPPQQQQSVAAAPAVPCTSAVQLSHLASSGDGAAMVTATTSARPCHTSATVHIDVTINSAKETASASDAANAVVGTTTTKTSFLPPDLSTAVAPTESTRDDHGHSRAAATTPVRKRTNTGMKTKTSVAAAPTSSEAAAPTTTAAVTTGSAHASAEQTAKRKVVRRTSDGGPKAATSTRPSSTVASRKSSTRGSASTPATAANTAPPTRDSSVAQPLPLQQQQQQHSSVTAAPPTAPDTESLISTALNTARESVSEFESSAVNTATVTSTVKNTVASLATLPRHSHGPVVTEEWTRSIIKPGDEQLLYAPANAAFALTPSGAVVKGARGSAVIASRKGSKGRTSPYDSQLRRAQQTVLQQRHIATPTPGRRTMIGAVTGASAAHSAASGGGSGSRICSTVKRSGTRLQQLRHEAEERQRSLNATLSTPNNDEGSALRAHGWTVGPSIGGPNSASPTPSHMSEASVNTGRGLGGGTPMSRRSTGSNEIPIENLPGAASISGGSRHTPPGHNGQHTSQQQQQQRNSPSFALFARPSTRIFATPSPRGSTGTNGVPGMMVTFGVSNNTPYYTGNEELTKLTRVREDMLRALLLASTTATPSTATPANAKENGGSATTPLSNPTSSLLNMQAGPRPGETTALGSTPESATKRPRQRIYGVDIRLGANGEPVVSPQKAPAADVSKPRGRLSSKGAETILISSIRQELYGAASADGSGISYLSPARNPAAAARGGSIGGSSSGAGASTRPKISTTATGPGDSTFSATNSAPRLPRRSAVTVALANLQPANTLGERVRAELVRQSEQTQKTAPVPRLGNGEKTAEAATATAKATNNTSSVSAPPRAAPLSFEEATRRLLLDPFFPLVSEENYQRLVLQNDEYNERKALVVRICAMPPPKPSPLPNGGGGSAGDDGAQSRRSGTVGPKAARALEIDLAEADEMPSVDALAATTSVDTSTTTPSLPVSFSLCTLSPGGGGNNASSSLSSNNNGNGGGAAPRRPSVQYGGPTTFLSPTQVRARSPSPGPRPTSPPLAAALNSPSALSPARDSKLIVNAVMPSEKTGPIKPLVLSSVWYAPTTVPADAGQSNAFQSTLCPSNVNNGTSTSMGNSPRRAYSRSPSASRSSSRHAARRGSLFHGTQQNVFSGAPASQSVSSDSESTASDEAVDGAETALRRVLPLWGPFRTAISSHSPQPPTSATGTASCSASTRLHRNSNSASTTSASSVRSSGHKGKKVGDSKSHAAVLPPAVLDELEAYVHFFMKRFRNANAATAALVGDVPETPVALQRAIRQSLRLSCDSVASGVAADDVDGVSTELQDPLDDGSYHSQNVQYVLDLLGSLLQMQDSFCEDVNGGRAAARGTKRNQAELTETEFLTTVMWHPPLDRGGQYDTDDDLLQKPSGGVGGKFTRIVRKSRAQLTPKLRNPELHAVELMFSNHCSAAAAKSNTTAEEKG